MLEFNETDELFIGNELLKEFSDCLECGICCKIFDFIELNDFDIKNISKHLDIDKKEFISRYTKEKINTETYSKISLLAPCPFQKSNMCTIHEFKPFDCTIFPLLINITKEKAVLSGIYLCPQSTNFFQGYLEYCKNYFPSVFIELIELESNASLSKLGLKLMVNSKSIESYIDWIHSKV